MSKKVLGIDLGPNSVGWALVDDDADSPESNPLIDLGVRVFPEGVDKYGTSKEVSRNESRRVARGMRRQTKRRTRRRDQLQAALIETGLWPEDAEHQEVLLGTDPYELRAKSLHEKLDPHEIGRVLLHLSRRRGFKSNRKKDRGDKEVTGILKEMEDNELEREESGAATIGEWLNEKKQDLDHADRQENDQVRGRHLQRSQDEFDAIWDAQKKHHGKLLSDELRYGDVGEKQDYPLKPQRRKKKKTALQMFGIHGLIFFQRNMYWPKSAVGQCELLPKQKRCDKADRRAQRFRLLQEVNNLRLITPQEERELTPAERSFLLEKLSSKKEMTFVSILNELNKLPDFPSGDVQINLQKGKRKGMQGIEIDALLAHKDVMGPKWYDRPEEEKNEIVRALIDFQFDENAFIREAMGRWGFSMKEAEKLLSVPIPSGHFQLSLEAIERLLPHMEKGLLYMTDDSRPSALKEAGFLRPDEIRKRLFGRLPNEFEWRQSPIADVPNPIVRRTLVELRKVVNAVIRKHGKIDAVHVEMARDMSPQPKKGTPGYKRYVEKITQMREWEAENTQAKEMLIEERIAPSRDNCIRYRLWLQQEKKCIYSGDSISFAQLFGEGEIDVDHILPRSRTLDNSQNNRVVCFRTRADGLGNQEKGNLTPYEWLADSRPDDYEAVCQRARKLPYPKAKRFFQKEVNLDDFVERQLNDTRYITKVAAEFLQCLFNDEQRKSGAVLGIKGQQTAELRWQWGLGEILQSLPDSPAWQAKNDLGGGEKNRADHRHHAIDAVVIALTNRSRLAKLSKLMAKGGAKKHGEILEDPWPTFRNDVVEKIKAVNVSHRVERKVRGALHEETLYGPTKKENEWVSRKPVEGLKANEIERIRDKTIRKIVIKRLQEAGVEFGRGKKPNAKQMQTALTDLRMKSGVPIKKVRITKIDQTIQPIREGKPGETYVKPGSTHHLCIFEWEENDKVKKDAVFVTMLEAMNRLKKGETVIQRVHPTRPEARFIMSLSSREMVEGNWGGEKRLLVYKTAASTTQNMVFVEHTDARKSGEQTKYNVVPSTLDVRDVRKVTVDPLGCVRTAND